MVADRLPLEVDRSQDKEHIADFRDWLITKGRSPRTLRTYEQSTSLLAEFLRDRGMPALEQARREHIEAWLGWQYEHGNKPSTVRNRFGGVQQFYNWMLHEDIRQDHPMSRIATPRVPDQVQPDYSAEQVSRLLASIKGSELFDLRDRAIVALFYDTGVRCQELCDIRVGDADRETRRLVVRKGKGGAGRIVGYSADTASLLNRYMRKRGGWDRVDPSSPLLVARSDRQLNPNAVRMLMLRRFRVAGIEFHGTHGFRRSFAQAFLDAGGDAMDLKQLAGWSSLSMLYRYTKRSAQERALRAVDQFSPMARLRQ